MFVVFTRIDGRPAARASAACWWNKARRASMSPAPITRWAARTCTRSSSMIASCRRRTSSSARTASSKPAQRLQHPALPQPGISLGLAEGAFDEAVTYVRGREVLGRAARRQAGHALEAGRHVQGHRGRPRPALPRLRRPPIRSPTRSRPPPPRCSATRWPAASPARRVQLHGGYGFTDEYPVSRLHRGARYGSLGGGATETLRDLIGRRLVRDIDGVQGILGLGTF